MIPSLRFVNISRRFGNHQRVAALADFSLDCPAGAVTCLVGPNGAGKSTALSLAAGLLPASEGQVVLGSFTITPFAPPRRLGYLPQISFFPGVLTVEEVLDFGFLVRRTEKSSRAETIVLCGLGSVLHKRVNTLSTGWLRRVGLAVALAPPTDLLLLDEPFVGLDLDTLDRISAQLALRATQGAVVLIASHEFEVIDQLQPRITVLHEGQLMASTAIGAGSSREFYKHTMKSGNELPTTGDAAHG